jgi:transcriptional regulator of acetoin/glycerol metabolism
MSTDSVCKASSALSKVVDYVNGHKTKAAKILGIGRKTLYRKIQELNLEP